MIMKTPFSHKSPKNGKSYYLHSKLVTLNNAKKTTQTIFYFAGEIDAAHVLYELPKGYEVTTNPRSGLPILRKLK
jgi:hypothetical protein